NSAGAYGGGLFTQDSTGVSLVNTTVSANVAQAGAGVRSSDSSVSLLHVTVASNSGITGFGGIIQEAGFSGRLMIVRNSLLADNASGNCYDGSKLVSGDGNVSSDSSCAAAFSKVHDHNNAAAVLGPLAENGGPTPTHLPQPGSAAVDAGVFTDVVNVDQRGVSRPQGIASDAGAVEVSDCPPGSALCGDANGST